jgi:hypothetical protein
MEIVLAWIFLSIAAGMFASIRRNRSGFGWFLSALVFSPVAMFVILAILRPKEYDARRAGGFRIPDHRPLGPSTTNIDWR